MLQGKSSLQFYFFCLRIGVTSTNYFGMNKFYVCRRIIIVYLKLPAFYFDVSRHECSDC